MSQLPIQNPENREAKPTESSADKPFLRQRLGKEETGFMPSSPSSWHKAMQSILYRDGLAQPGKGGGLAGNGDEEVFPNKEEPGFAGQPVFVMGYNDGLAYDQPDGSQVNTRTVQSAHDASMTQADVDSLITGLDPLMQAEEAPVVAKPAEMIQFSSSFSQADINHLVTNIEPMAQDDGIFELLFPDGRTLGVVVNMQPGRVNFLFNPSSSQLRDGLRGKQMELEGHLKRRIGADVKLTVL